ncbi:MAG: hypothetical protein LC751_08535 [Actinobacteria bacterium]|nr:hypothetical protein [Actinomycetota bacterium]MCA1737365.1 hypothetical protein [Actinomycetota bacterium]
MNEDGQKGVRWRSVALGWIVAAFAGAVITPLLRVLYNLVSEPPVERGEFTSTIVVISLVSGFLAYLAGGYVAGKLASYSGGLNGVMIAIFGLILGVVLATILSFSGTIFAEGVAMPPMCFGFSGGALLASLSLFLVNIFGGYVGGKLGEPSRSKIHFAGPRH